MLVYADGNRRRRLPSAYTIELIGDAPSKCMTPTLATTASKSLTKFLDVRRQDEFDLGHCTGISHVVWDGDACWQRGQSDPACAAFIQGMEALVTPADGLTRYATPIFIHCKSGSRAGQVAKFLQGRNWTQTKTTASDFGVEYASDYSGSKFSNFVVTMLPFAMPRPSLRPQLTPVLPQLRPFPLCRWPSWSAISLGPGDVCTSIADCSVT